MSDFDASSFLETVFQEPSATEYLNCPVGEYPAIVDKLDARKWAKDGKSGIFMDVMWSIEDEGAKLACKRDKVIVKQGIGFDLTPDGLIDMEKAKANVPLGKLRDALGLNTGNFNPSMLMGRMAKVRITHSTYVDKSGAQALQANIAAVTKY